MKLSTGLYKGLRCCCLENEMVKLTVIPELGAKIGSVIYKPQKFEVLFQPVDGSYRLPVYGADFAQYDTSGADEMFPTIDSCTYPYVGYAGRKLPDHGELWSVPWVITKENGQLTSQARGVALPYIFSRRITLQGSTIHMEYKVTNVGTKPLYGLWAFHGLVACDELTQIMIPDLTQVLTVHDSEVLGQVGTIHEFPVATSIDGTEYSLDRIAPQSAKKTEKFYVNGPVKKGQAALTLNKGQLLYKLLFPVHKVPYLGIWLNEGGFKNEYNCALEPSTGYYDSLELSKQQESLKPLEVGGSIEWYLDIELTPWAAEKDDGFVDKR